MLLARELPQVVVPESYLPLDLNGARINIEKAAYHGFAKAQVKMGAAYELCQLGCDFNPALSLHYNELAARQGEPDAEMAISKWFLCGHEGVFEKNDEMAFKYAQRAAQSGLATAEFALGYFHEIGIYVPVDIKEARKWYAKAAASGNKDAAGRIDSISRSKTLSRKDHERVAIARIKSQYASHGRKQAPRYSESHDIPPVQDNLEMPDPSKMRISPGDLMPPRPASAAPYPDGPNSATYPRLSAQSNYQKPDFRPNSAFGINPNIRPHSVSPGGLPAGNRVVSASQGPQGYRQPSPGINPSLGSHQGNGNQTPLPKVDIGFSAPPDPSGADRRRRLQRPESANPAQAPSIPGRTSYGGASPGRRTDGMQSSPALGGDLGYGRQSSAGQFPPRNESRPSKSTAPASSPNRPAQKPTIQPANPPATALPGKGPKTFEEMGVPEGKSDGDCVRIPPYLYT